MKLSTARARDSYPHPGDTLLHRDLDPNTQETALPGCSPVCPPSHPRVLPSVVASPPGWPSPGLEAAPVAPTVSGADAWHVGPLGQHLEGSRWH